MSKELIRRKEKITCNSCGHFTPYVVKKKKMFGEFEHLYAECDKCGYKKTVYYTNKKLRSLLKSRLKKRMLAKRNC